MYGFWQVICLESGEVVGTNDSEFEAERIGMDHQLATALPGYGRLWVVRLAPWVG